VEVTTFDCVSELHKIAAGYPSFKCVLRIRCDDASAKINLGLKYGADMCDVPMLLGLARDLGLQVVGVSFHVGSGCQNVGIYADAIAAAREVGFGVAAQAEQFFSDHTHIRVLIRSELVSLCQQRVVDTPQLLEC
jgi:ornithine decarboxylase